MKILFSEQKIILSYNILRAISYTTEIKFAIIYFDGQILLGTNYCDELDSITILLK